MTNLIAVREALREGIKAGTARQGILDPDEAYEASCSLIHGYDEWILPAPDPTQIEIFASLSSADA